MVEYTIFVQVEAENGEKAENEYTIHTSKKTFDLLDEIGESLIFLNDGVDISFWTHFKELKRIDEV